MRTDIVGANLAAPVRGPEHVVKRDKTPALTAEHFATGIEIALDSGQVDGLDFFDGARSGRR